MFTHTLSATDRVFELKYFKLLKEIYENSLSEEIVAHIQEMGANLWNWVCVDLTKRGIIFYHVINSKNKEVLDTISKERFSIMMHYLIQINNPSCFEYGLSYLTEQSDKIQNLLSVVLKENQIEFISCLIKLITITNFEEAKKIAEFIAMLGDEKSLLKFIDKTAHFNRSEKEILFNEHIKPFWLDLSSLNHGIPVSNQFEGLKSLYDTADQNFHLNAIINMSRRIAYRLKKGNMQMNTDCIRKLGEWRQKLAFVNHGCKKLQNASQFGTMRYEINTCTMAESTYESIDENMNNIDYWGEDKSRIRINITPNEFTKCDYQAIIFYIIKEKEVIEKISDKLQKPTSELSEEDLTINLTMLHKNHSAKSLVVHINPEYFWKVQLMLDYEINKILAYKCDLNNPTSIEKVTHMIGRVQWWWEHATFFKRGSETVGDAIMRGLFFYHSLYFNGYVKDKNTPVYTPALTSPNIENYAKIYGTFLENLQPIPHHFPKEEKFIEWIYNSEKNQNGITDRSLHRTLTRRNRH